MAPVVARSIIFHGDAACFVSTTDKGVTLTTVGANVPRFSETLFRSITFILGERCFELSLDPSQPPSPPPLGCEGFQAGCPDPGAASSTDGTSCFSGPHCVYGHLDFSNPAGLTLTRWRMNQLYHKIPSHFTWSKTRLAVQSSLKIKKFAACWALSKYELLLMKWADVQVPFLDRSLFHPHSLRPYIPEESSQWTLLSGNN